MFDKHVAQLIGSDSTIDKSAFVRLIIAVVSADKNADCGG